MSKEERLRIIQNHFNLFGKRKERYPNIKDVVILNGDLEYWHIIAYNIPDTIFEGAEIIIRLHMAPTIMQPPTMCILTKTGIFEPGKNICTTISSYHPENYTPAMGILGFVQMNILTFLFYKDLKNGVGVIRNPSEKEIKDCLHNSKNFNWKNYNNILMESSFKDEYVAMFDKPLIVEKDKEPADSTELPKPARKGRKKNIPIIIE